LQIPLITQKIARQLEQAKADHIDSWLQGIREQTSLSSKIDILRIGDLRAFVAPHLQEIGLFNQTIGLGPDNQEALQEVEHFYHHYRVETYRLEINPYHTSSEFLAYLAVRKFSPSRFETYLYGTPEHTVFTFSDNTTIREITASEVDLFATIHVKGYQEALASVSETQYALYRESTKVLYHRLGWRLCFMCKNNLPIGMGMLYTANGIATFAGGATLPEYRQRGGQTALIQYLLEASAQAHCEIAVAQTSVGSGSQQNVERSGMRTAYIASSWILRDSSLG